MRYIFNMCVSITCKFKYKFKRTLNRNSLDFQIKLMSHTVKRSSLASKISSLNDISTNSFREEGITSGFCFGTRGIQQNNQYSKYVRKYFFKRNFISMVLLYVVICIYTSNGHWCPLMLWCDCILLLHLCLTFVNLLNSIM